MRELTILGGCDKFKNPEAVRTMTLRPGQLYTIVGNTGAGKSRFIKDLEQLAQGDTVTGRRVLLDGKEVPKDTRMEEASSLVAHLGQNMRFTLDLTVEEFLKLHIRCRKKEVGMEAVLALANLITPEPVEHDASLNLLSGGQTRALMIADIALICDSPVVLIDEVENAGIDKEQALEALLGREKLVLMVTHDVHTALMAKRRIIMERGAVKAVVERNEKEELIYQELTKEYRNQKRKQQLLRQGENLS